MKSSICFFSSYFLTPDLPFYVTFYIRELCNHFEKVIFLTNEKELSAESHSLLQTLQIEYVSVKNEGYDFGMWAKAFEQFDVSGYNHVGLINDSCILFKSLDETFEKVERSSAAYIGLIQSNRYAPHIQSFFVIIKKEAIAQVIQYFQKKGVITDYREVIQQYEIGLCTYLLQKGIAIEGLFGKGFEAHPTNPSFTLCRQLVDEGIPVLKKKLIFRNYRGLEYYWLISIGCTSDYRPLFAQIIAKYGKEEVIDFEKVMRDAPHAHHIDIAALKVGIQLAHAARRIPAIPQLFRWSKNGMKRLLRK